jgi:hypothetical protein
MKLEIISTDRIYFGGLESKLKIQVSDRETGNYFEVQLPDKVYSENELKTFIKTDILRQIQSKKESQEYSRAKSETDDIRKGLVGKVIK